MRTLCDTTLLKRREVAPYGDFAHPELARQVCYENLAVLPQSFLDDA
jgi:hypothetical protein